MILKKQWKVFNHGGSGTVSAPSQGNIFERNAR